MVGSFIDDRDGWSDSFQVGGRRNIQETQSDVSTLSRPESYIDDRYVEIYDGSDIHSTTSTAHNHASHLSSKREGDTFTFTPIRKPPIYVIREKRGHLKILNEHCRSLQRSRPFYGTEEERAKEAETYADEVKRAMVKIGVHPQYQKQGESGLKAVAAKEWPKTKQRACPSREVDASGEKSIKSRDKHAVNVSEKGRASKKPGREQHSLQNDNPFDDRAALDETKSSTRTAWYTSASSESSHPAEKPATNPFDSPVPPGPNTWDTAPGPFNPAFSFPAQPFQSEPPMMSTAWNAAPFGPSIDPVTETNGTMDTSSESTDNPPPASPKPTSTSKPSEQRPNTNFNPSSYRSTAAPVVPNISKSTVIDSRNRTQASSSPSKSQSNSKSGARVRTKRTPSPTPNASPDPPTVASPPTAAAAWPTPKRRQSIMPVQVPAPTDSTERTDRRPGDVTRLRVRGNDKRQGTSSDPRSSDKGKDDFDKRPSSGMHQQKPREQSPDQHDKDRDKDKDKDMIHPHDSVSQVGSNRSSSHRSRRSRDGRQRSHHSLQGLQPVRQQSSYRHGHNRSRNDGVDTPGTAAPSSWLTGFGDGTARHSNTHNNRNNGKGKGKGKESNNAYHEPANSRVNAAPPASRAGENWALPVADPPSSSKAKTNGRSHSHTNSSNPTTIKSTSRGNAAANEWGATLTPAATGGWDAPNAGNGGEQGSNGNNDGWGGRTTEATGGNGGGGGNDTWGDQGGGGGGGNDNWGGQGGSGGGGFGGVTEGPADGGGW